MTVGSLHSRRAHVRVGGSRSRRRVTGWAAVAMLAVALSSVGVGVAPAGSRTLATCTPIAWVPDTGGRRAAGWGYVRCDGGSPSFQYTVRLVNRSGGILSQASGGPLSIGQQVQTAVAGCAGAWVHSYLYINVGGAGKSDSSGEPPQC
jgi:hypothetical protein